MSSAFDKVFREYLVQTVNRVKMAFSNLCRNDLTSVSLFAYHIYKVPCSKPRTIDRYEHWLFLMLIFFEWLSSPNLGNQNTKLKYIFFLIWKGGLKYLHINYTYCNLHIMLFFLFLFFEHYLLLRFFTFYRINTKSTST